MKIGDLCSYAPKSSVKAGEAVVNGSYMFFTSSSDESKRYSDFQLDCEGIIMGTGGNATLHYYNGKFATSTDCVVLIPNNMVRCKYLYYFFLSNMAVLEDGFKGAGLKHTNKNYINSIEISTIPSLEEQDKVIKILDKTQSIINERKKEILKLSELIKARFVEMFGDLSINSLGFEESSVDEYCCMTQGVQIPMSEQITEHRNGYYRYLYIRDLKYDDNDWIYVLDRYNEKKLTENDLVVVNTGNTAGEIYRGKNGILSNNLFKVSFDSEVLSTTYMFYYFRSDVFQNMLWSEMKEGTQPHLGHKIFGSKKLLIPPMALQEQFADFVKQVDKSKFAVQKSLEETQLLFDSLMQEYFG